MVFNLVTLVAAAHSTSLNEGGLNEVVYLPYVFED
jgi:hypothetical protein